MVKRSPAWEALEAWGGRLVFLALDPTQALALIGLLPPERAAVLSWDDSPALAILRAAGVFAEAFGAAGGERRTASLLAAPRARALLRSWSEEGPVGVVAFKPDARLVRALEQGLPEDWSLPRGRIRCLCGPVGVARRFENKLRFPQLVPGLNMPPARIRAAKEGDFADLAAELGRPFVAQRAASFSGSGTALIEDLAGWRAFIAGREGRPVKASALLAGPSVAINGCVSEGGVALGPASEQRTGDAALTPYPLGSCGNVWSADAAAWPGARAAAGAVGEALRGAGYRGFFGVDVIAGSAAAVIECNARLTASFFIEALAARRFGGLALFDRHVLAGLGLEAEGAEAPPFALRQWILRHRGAERVSEAGAWGVVDRRTGATAALPLDPEAFIGALFDPDRATLIGAGAGRRLRDGLEMGRLLTAGPDLSDPAGLLARRAERPLVAGLAHGRGTAQGLH